MATNYLAIPMGPVREKLRNLRDYMPVSQVDDIVYRFGRFLADRLERKTELNPAGFNLTIELALRDLQTGTDSYTKQPVPEDLAGYPQVAYRALRGVIPDIARAVCPEDFAEGVRQVYKDVNERMLTGRQS